MANRLYHSDSISELSSVDDSTRTCINTSSSESFNEKGSYIDFIKSCYSLFPDSEGYYEKLVSFLSQHTTYVPSKLQSLDEFDIRQFDESITSFNDIFCPTVSDSARLKNQGSRITVTKGFVSPSLVAKLGSELRLRPEFFLNHIDIDRKQKSTPYKLHELPTVPSRLSTSIHIRILTLVNHHSATPKPQLYSQTRTRINEKCHEHERQLFDQGRYGATRFRKIYIHDSQFCSFEQMVSCSVSQKQNSWNSVFLLDNGRPDENTDLPWTQIPDTGRPLGSIPIVPLGNEPSQSPFRHDDSDGSVAIDSKHPFKHIFIEDSVDHLLLLEDPFKLISGILVTAALASSQMINFLKLDVKKCSIAPLEQLEHALEQLRFNVGLIDRIEESLIENQQLIQLGGCPSWPKAKSLQTRKRKSELQVMLGEDYSTLIKRCNRLSKKCERSINVLVSFAQLKEAQRGLSQTDQFHSLARLAFVFIPLSFIASIFGMNVAEFRLYPSIGWYFLIAVPLSAVVWFASCWNTGAIVTFGAVFTRFFHLFRF
ncbi:hypothetical protein BP6252_05028 [Coleophoma cylindrospora]|uniref:Uncharacterized protein n=1 Tax=Coleophoma cylindrospora TaxID=1849047 RepID=A0A3D8RSK6_9HELO|nr:hypothetical protein BP6252_05028 [Coleophoma cylindrospora]